jgi:polyphosphate glucokinase
LKILVIDVGGTHVKALVTGRRTPVKIDSGPTMTPSTMVAELSKAIADWQFDVVSIGFPGPVRDGKPAREPWNLGAGWKNFDFEKAFKRPVRIINDAAMQALGSYEGHNMLFLGLGTGLGSTMIRDGVLIPLELAHLPYRKGKSYEQYLGVAGYERLGKRSWRKHVETVVALFVAALEVDYVVLGGGNARHLNDLPPNTRLGENANAFKGGFRLWDDGPVPARVVKARQKRTGPNNRPHERVDG